MSKPTIFSTSSPESGYSEIDPTMNLAAALLGRIVGALGGRVRVLDTVAADALGSVTIDRRIDKREYEIRVGHANPGTEPFGIELPGSAIDQLELLAKIARIGVKPKVAKKVKKRRPPPPPPNMLLPLIRQDERVPRIAGSEVASRAAGYRLSRAGKLDL